MGDMVAALFVQQGGCYFGLEGVDPWDEARDARLYAGPWPVVAHPPCSRWCRLAGLVEARWGYKRGDDGGCFASALTNVRAWGGVLEHPAYSDAFAAHGIPAPLPAGWQRTLDGGWVCHVEQWHYGHEAKKATWLYVFGVDVPSMIWGTTPDTAKPAYVTDGGGQVKRGRALISWCGNHVKDGEDRKRLGKKAAAATPIAFRDLLIGIARTARTNTSSASGAQAGDSSASPPNTALSIEARRHEPTGLINREDAVRIGGGPQDWMTLPLSRRSSLNVNESGRGCRGVRKLPAASPGAGAEPGASRPAAAPADQPAAPAPGMLLGGGK